MTNNDKIVQFLSNIDAGRDSYRQGVELVNAGEFEAGIAAFQEALQVSPNFPQAYAWLGYAYLEQALQTEADLDMQLAGQALYAAEQALQFDICPQNACALAHYVLAVVHLKVYGDRDYALKKYELIRQLNQKFANMLKNRLDQP
ncbi:MAG: tetratricopeptide repeat protein [Desulfobacca sp.]|nr:tetratricopeptide repeat protein [Desulfobacca sp.]